VANITGKTIIEPSRELKVCRETEVLVVGGGPAGVAAVIVAAQKTRGARYRKFGNNSNGVSQ
jgi:alkyl hydroperoxide reductase subunit AhpF